MRTIVMQDWITLNGVPGVLSLTQSEHDYLDMAPFESFVAYFESREAEPGNQPMKVYLETAPAKDEALFAPANMTQTNATIAQVSISSPGVIVIPNLLNDPLLPTQVPLARWLRWRIDLGGSSTFWAVTFRIILSAHAVVL